MRSRFFHRPVLHSPAPGMEKRASWLELFYDLVFVAAFIQLGNGLAQDLSFACLMTFGRVFLLLWVAWTGLTFFVNRFTLDDAAQRGLVLLQMFAVGALTLSAPRALAGQHDLLFLAAGVALLLIAAMHLRTYLQEPHARAYSRFWGLSFGAAGVVWIVAAALPEYLATPLSLMATLGLLGMPLSARSRQLTERFPLDLHHLSERYGLLTIIVLGESFVKVVTALGGMHSQAPWATGAATLLLASSLWWVYFDDVAGSRIRTGHGQWIVWLYGHVPLQMGVVLMAVALKKFSLVPPHMPAPTGVSALLTGSLSLVFFAVAALDSATERRNAELSDRARVNVRAATGLLLLVLVPVAKALPSGGFLALLVGIGVLQVVFDMVVAPHDEGPAANSEPPPNTAELTRRQRAEGGALPRIGIGERQILRKGTPTELRRDLYFFLMEGSFWRVLAAFGGLFVVVNVFFAALYLAEPGSIAGAAPGSLHDAFFFSVQTMSTIGYGALTPQSTWGHMVVTAEAALSLMGVATVTGLLFARLSRPRAAVLFSRPILLGRLHGQPVLMFRAANARGNEVVDAQVTLTVLMDELTPEGHHFRRLVDLPVVRARSPMFMLSWTVIHPIDDNSPLRDVDFSHPETHLANFIVTLMGHDSTYGQVTYSRHMYELSDLVVGERFVDVIHLLPDGRTLIDYESFHDTVPEDGPV